MTETLIEKRSRLLGPNFSTFYKNPVHIVRGEGVWLWDSDGEKYLDCYNNVPHVGHCHSHVVEAITNYGCYEMDEADQKLFDESIRTKHFCKAIHKGCRTIWIQESEDDDKININFKKKDMYLGNE